LLGDRWRGLAKGEGRVGPMPQCRGLGRVRISAAMASITGMLTSECFERLDTKIVRLPEAHHLSIQMGDEPLPVPCRRRQLGGILASSAHLEEDSLHPDCALVRGVQSYPGVPRGPLSLLVPARRCRRLLLRDYAQPDAEIV